VACFICPDKLSSLYWLVQRFNICDVESTLHKFIFLYGPLNSIYASFIITSTTKPQETKQNPFNFLSTFILQFVNIIRNIVSQTSTSVQGKNFSFMICLGLWTSHYYTQLFVD
jgi:hypothetical protein